MGCKGERCPLTLMLPIRRARDAATRVDAAATMLVIKNKVPRKPSRSANLRLKKNVTQDLEMISR